MAVDFATLGDDIVDAVGGLGNIKTARHCATRLRLELRDEDKAATDKVKGLKGVLAVVQAGGQYQVVIGNDVPFVYARIAERLEGGGAVEEVEDNSNKSILNKFIDLVTGLFHPILWPLAGAGLFKAFVSMFATFGWLNTESTEYVVLNAASDALIYFLPLLLAISAAKRFKTNQFTSMAIAGALVYPTIVALTSAEGSLTFFGIPLVIMSYTSSVIPIIVGVWVQGYLERFLLRTLPGAIRNFTTPLLCMLIMVPLILLTIGPATTILANAIADGITWLFHVAPWLAGALMGGLWQVFVIFGLHWGFVPIMVQQLSTGYAIITGPLAGAVLAQAAATFAVWIRTKDHDTRELAGPSAFSGFLSGITEPGIYGVNLPRKLPFYFGIAGGAIGGVFAGIAGAGTTTFVFPSLIALPAYLSTPNLPLFFIGLALSMAIGFLGTLFWGVKDPAPVAASEAAEVPAEAAAASAPATVGTEVIVRSPMDGTLVAIGDVPDPVFASGAMGAGIGVEPTSGTVYSPVTGTIIVTMGSGHAYGIRTDEGVEVLVHVGIDTVNMKGEGFEPKVAQGDRVNAGDVLVEVDLGKITQAGYSTTTVVIITNTATQKGVAPGSMGAVTHDDTALIVTV
ncbi:beta-glucoside-specific PTS transporter subunit IIABC [Micropruina sp.]|uniref:beta-glucoside-specific PTS transporter subunit IIABC n=1 Tax=Micropruina sp. TaxID=2737536 RepID=UPI00260E496E|nr:beta-glucoside-specific PTS transporter subunit IIABC [Micropruina sp.]